MDENSQQPLIELTPVWNHIIHIWWAHLWRILVSFIVAFFVSFSVSFLLAMILSLFRVPINIIAVIAYPIAALIWLGITIFPMKMIIGKKFNGFRLVIVEDKN